MSSLWLSVSVLENAAQSSGAQSLGGVTFSMGPPGKAIPASQGTFGRIRLEARRAAALLQGVPNELRDDGGAAFAAWIGPVIVQGYTEFETDLLLNGSGVGEPEGILNAACQVQVTRAGSDAVALAEVTAMKSRLAAPSRQSGRAVWIASPAVEDQLLELTQAAGGAAALVMTPDPDRRGHRLAGLPLLTTSHSPDLGTTGDLVLADLSFYAIGDRRMLTVEQSKQGERFINDTSDYKFTSRIDARYLLRAPITPANGGATVSPLVVLGPSS